MPILNKPLFIIKKSLQKSAVTGEYFSDQINLEVLKDICIKITGKTEFDCKFVDNSYEDEYLSPTYNKGRLALLHYNKSVSYISFSEVNINGRNSSVQSVPTAFNLFYFCKNPSKKLYYYFLKTNGNIETSYHKFIYRLMKTVGFIFLNDNMTLNDSILPFTSIADLRLARQCNSGRNQSNNPTYITKSSSTNIDLYGKTYGASKYETSLLCYAISKLANNVNKFVTLYEVAEGNLRSLPQSSIDVINTMDNISIVPADIQLERKYFNENDSLRSPRYIYNLLERLGNKKCAFCGCKIPEIIQGAHILPVAMIKKNNNLTFEQKIEHATNAHNGIWLCENHHKLFDENIIKISIDGHIEINENLNNEDKLFLENITTSQSIDINIMSNEFCHYLELRNNVVNF